MQDERPRTPIARRRTYNPPDNELIRVVRTSGELCQLSIVGWLPTSVPDRNGTAIVDISPSARFRLLKAIARIDWQSITNGAFITLTYPDNQANANYEKMTSHRHQLIRDVEKDSGAQTPMLWRKEYKPRKTGKHTGIMVPHFHIAVLGKLASDEQRINDVWTRIIGATQHVQTDIKPLRDGKHAAFYMAKYLTKKETSLSILDYPAYLNNTGRTWGWHRKGLLSMAPIEEVAFLTEHEYSHLLDFARAVAGRNGPYATDTATIIGTAAQLVKEEISRMGLDRCVGVQ